MHAELTSSGRVRELALTFMGHRGQEVGPGLMSRIDEEVRRCGRVATPRQVARTFAASELPLELEGEAIGRHLAGAREVTLIACTVGAAVDRELRRLALIDPVAQVIFDAVASAAVERLVDAVEARLRAEARRRGLFCGYRFSPGYADLPLAVQGRLLAVLDATRRVGITVTDTNLMVPTKSVTAIIGAHREPQAGLASACDICDLRDLCALRGTGVTCRS